MTAKLTPKHQRSEAQLYWDRKLESDRRFKKVEAQYKVYLEEWKERIYEAHKRGAVKGRGTPDWLPYYVKHIEDAD